LISYHQTSFVSIIAKRLSGKKFEILEAVKNHLFFLLQRKIKLVLIEIFVCH